MAAPSIAASISIPLDALTFTVVAAPPELLSQLNVLAVLGVSPRTYLEAIRAPGFPLPVIRLGKLRLVDRVAFVARLRSQSASSSAPTPANDGEPEDKVEGDGFLAELGLSRVKPPRAAKAGR